MGLIHCRVMLQSLTRSWGTISYSDSKYFVFCYILSIGYNYCACVAQTRSEKRERAGIIAARKLRGIIFGMFQKFAGLHSVSTTACVEVIHKLSACEGSRCTSRARWAYTLISTEILTGMVTYRFDVLRNACINDNF